MKTNQPRDRNGRFMATSTDKQTPKPKGKTAQAEIKVGLETLYTYYPRETDYACVEIRATIKTDRNGNIPQPLQRRTYHFLGETLTADWGHENGKGGRYRTAEGHFCSWKRAEDWAEKKKEEIKYNIDQLIEEYFERQANQPEDQRETVVWRM